MKYGATFDMESGFSVVEETREAAISELIASDGCLAGSAVGEILEVFTCIAAVQNAATFVPTPDRIEEFMQDEGSKALSVALIKWANEYVSKPRFFSPVAIERCKLTVGKDALGQPYIVETTTTNELGETDHTTVIVTEVVQMVVDPYPQQRNYVAP